MPDQTPSYWQIAATFNAISMQSFGGGVNANARRVLVDDRQWLTDEEFLQTLSVCQILPGPNTSNLAVFVGSRLRGLRGGVSALLGLLSLPMLIVIAMGGLYFWKHTVPHVQPVLRGVGSAAVGLSLGLAIRLGAQHRRDPVVLAFGGIGFVAVALLHFSMIPVIVTLGPCAVLLLVRRVARAEKATHE